MIRHWVEQISISRGNPKIRHSSTYEKQNEINKENTPNKSFKQENVSRDNATSFSSLWTKLKSEKLYWKIQTSQNLAYLPQHINQANHNE